MIILNCIAEDFCMWKTGYSSLIGESNKKYACREPTLNISNPVLECFLKT